MKSKFSLILFLIISIQTQAQNSTIDPGKVFGRIYTGYYHFFDEAVQPQSGFGFTTGIIGYTRKLGTNVRATLLYDVTRTTNFSGLDTLGFEGSKYTAFLKMAQIDWNITDKIGISAGQLLNQQYLTVQDKWWGFRYVCVTYQEKFRYGMPADFGLRLNYKPSEKLSFSLNAVNGEGPFRYQDNQSDFLISLNAEYNPLEHVLLKAYVDMQNQSEVNGAMRNVISLFAGYKASQDLMFGFEYNQVLNNAFVDGNDLDGISVYASKKVMDKTRILARLDYGKLFSSQNNYHGLIGIEYEPTQNFAFAVTYRQNDYMLNKNLPQLGLNFGIKF